MKLLESGFKTVAQFVHHFGNWSWWPHVHVHSTLTFISQYHSSAWLNIFSFMFVILVIWFDAVVYRLSEHGLVSKLLTSKSGLDVWTHFRYNTLRKREEKGDMVLRKEGESWVFISSITIGAALLSSNVEILPILSFIFCAKQNLTGFSARFRTY